MKRLYLPILLIFSLLLSSCGKNRPKEHFDDFINTLCQTEGLSFTAKLRSEYDDKTVSFTIDYVSDAEGCTVTVKEPALIRGISAHVAAGETALQFASLVLDVGELDAFGLSPMSALPLLVDALKNGCCDSVWEENGAVSALLKASDNLSVQILLDKYTLIPTHAELISEGMVKVFIDIEEWNTI